MSLTGISYCRTSNDIRKLDEFNKDFKKLIKKFKTLDEDLNTFIVNQLKLTHKMNIDNKGVLNSGHLLILRLLETQK